MSIFEKKEKNLNLLIDKLDVLTSTYSQPSYEFEKIKTEKNEILRQKSEIEKIRLNINTFCLFRNILLVGQLSGDWQGLGKSCG